jgi:hypothetical protein
MKETTSLASILKKDIPQLPVSTLVLKASCITCKGTWER